MELKYEYCINEGKNEREFDEFVSKVSDEDEEEYEEFTADGLNMNQNTLDQSMLSTNKRSNT